MRRSLSLFVALAAPTSLAHAALAEPANVSCEAAEPLTLSTAVSASTTDVVTKSAPSPCGSGDAFARWYTFTAPEAGRYTVLTDDVGGLTDTVLELFKACDQPAACVDDGLHTLFAAADVDLVAGETVRIRASGWGGRRGDVELRVAHFEDLKRPPNDACADAIALVQGVPVSSSTLFSTGDAVGCPNEDSSDIWYSFVATSEGDYDFSLTQNLTSANHMNLQSSCDDLCVSSNSSVTASKHLLAGEKVFLRVSTNPDVADFFNVNVGPLPPQIAPTNDSFTTATPIATFPATVHGTTIAATADNIYFGPTCGAFVNAGVWYSFTAPADGTYVLDTSDSELADTVLAVMGPCGENGASPPSLYACNDEEGTGSASRLEGDLVAGQSICVFVAGRYLSEHGDFVLHVGPRPPRPPNDHCEGATPLGFPDQVTADDFGSEPEDSTLPCPDGNFARWYAFTAPQTGDYKFDTKATVDAQPDLALYDACGASVSACSGDPFPELVRHMDAGESVRVRVSTDVFVRGPMVLRVGPAFTDDGTGGAGGATTSASAASTSASTSSSSSAGGGGAGGAAPKGGCDCAVGIASSEDGGGAAAWLGALVLAAVGAGRARKRRVP